VKGVTCPACGRACYELGNGKLSQHKTDQYVWGQRAGGRVRERCVYSGGTWADAEARIAPLRRLLIDKGLR
jgi:hypothetical protein